MHWEPDERKRSEPEQDEADEVVDGASKSDLSGQRRTGSERGPDGQDHQVDTFTSDPSLDTIPNTGRLSDWFETKHQVYIPCHKGSVQNRPQGPPDTERRAIDDWKRDMVYGTDATGQTDKEC